MKRKILLITIILFVTLNSIFAGWRYSSDGSIKNTWIANDSNRIIKEQINPNIEESTYILHTFLLATFDFFFVLENTEKELDDLLITNSPLWATCYSSDGDTFNFNLSSPIIDKNSIGFVFVPGDSTIKEQTLGFFKMLLEGDVTLIFNYKSDCFIFNIDNSNFENKSNKIMDMIYNQE